MDPLFAYVPQDRRATPSASIACVTYPTGAALFADISGFTPLTEALARTLGPRRGAEALTQQINAVYEALLEAVERYGGSVVGFAGDAVTCWFDDEGMGDGGWGMGAQSPSPIPHPPSPAPLRAVACARAMHAAMDRFAALPHPLGGTLTLHLKIAIASGPARRFVVGDPQAHVLDVLAGATIDRMAAAEHLAQAAEIVVDEGTIAALGEREICAWRTNPSTGARFAVITPAENRELQESVVRRAWSVAGYNGQRTTDNGQRTTCNEQLRPWLLPMVYQRLAAGQGEFLTELRPVVACFIRFGALDYDADPDAPAKLDAYIRWVQQVVAAYEGAVLQLTLGDKGSYLYVAWGAPLAHEDDVYRAAHAALELRAPPPAFSYIGAVQIGLSRGEMRTGAYGSALRRTYGALGDEVNLAARLMQAAAPGQILASGRVHAACAADFAWETLPPLHVKGKQGLIPVYELHSAHHTSIRLHEPRYGVPLIGRRKELAQITAILERAAAGAGQIVGVVGEAGLGKSRLVAEAMRAAHAAGWAVYGGAALSYGASSPYLAWQPIWRAFFRLPGDSGSEAAQIQRELARLLPGTGERLPLLELVLGLPLLHTELTASMDEKLRKESREALLIDLLQVHARQRPVLLVLEDCHWLDPLSQELLDAIGRAIADLPVALLLTYRVQNLAQAPLPRITALPYFTALPLTSLGADEAAAFLTTRLLVARPGGRLSPLLIERLVERAQGNPFYLEELLAYLIDQGVDLTDPAIGAQVELPVSLQSLILSRVDQLGDRVQLTLKLASVLGRLIRVAWLACYQSILGTADQLQPDLAELARLELIVLDAPEPDLAYLFKHIITHAAIYGSLAEEVRLRLHGQVGAWLEQTESADLDLLAYHYGLSTNTAKRREYLRRAGDAAAATWSNAAAASYYERLLPELTEADSERSTVLWALGEILERQGEWDAATARYTAALAAATDPQTQAAAAHGLGVVRCKQGAHKEASNWLEQACSTYAAAGDAAGMIRSQTEIGRVYWLQGEYHQAREILEKTLLAAQAAQDSAAIPKILYHLGILAVRQGDLATAQPLLEESLSSYQQQGNRAACASVLNSLGIVALEQQAFERAQARLEESLALRHELGDRWGLALTLGNLGLMAQSQGSWKRAQSLHMQSLRLSQELGDRVGTANTLQNLWCGAIEQGDQAQAREHMAACLALCSELGPGAPTPAALVAAAATIAPGAVAAQALGAGMRLLAAQSSVLEALEQRVYDRAEAAIRAALGAAAFESAFAEGQALEWDHAISIAQEALAL
jgi:predicted ATPase/class 3 adenylate cyclase